MSRQNTLTVYLFRRWFFLSRNTSWNSVFLFKGWASKFDLWPQATTHKCSFPVNPLLSTKPRIFQYVEIPGECRSDEPTFWQATGSSGSRTVGWERLELLEIHEQKSMKMHKKHTWNIISNLKCKKPTRMRWVNPNRYCKITSTHQGEASQNNFCLVLSQAEWYWKDTILQPESATELWTDWTSVLILQENTVKKKIPLPSTKLTCPTWGSSENHRLKSAFQKGDMLVAIPGG